MLWVLAAIGCFVVVHTIVNVAYRKPERPHEPVAEARERQRKFVHGDMKGWARYAAGLAPPTAGAASGETASVTRQPPPEKLATALPFDLVGIFTTDPRLHTAPAAVTAPTVVRRDDGLRVLLRFDAAAKPVAFGEALAYAKDQHLYLFLQDETRTMLEEPPTPFAATLELSLPPNVLPPGDWQASLYAEDAAFSWQFTVRDAARP